MKQQNLFSNNQLNKREWKRLNRRVHGGASTKGKRKEQRPLAARKWMHVILKSEKARGRYSFLNVNNRIAVKSIVAKRAKKFGIVISDYANVGNHLHMTLKAQNREGFANFLRTVTALIARHVTGARKGKPFGKFWQGLAFSRVLTSRFEELQIRGYLNANRIEAEQSKQAREVWLGRWNRYVRNLKAQSP